MYVVLLVLSLFIYVSSLSDCILDDFTKTISTCDETSHTRSIKYIYNKNCQIKNESLIFYTKIPLYQFLVIKHVLLVNSCYIIQH